MRETVDWMIAVTLLIIAVRDWKTRQISYGMLLVLGGMSIVGRVLAIHDSVWITIGGILIGIVLFITGKCTNEAIGYGDCWVITLLGIYLGIVKLLQVVLAASIGASLFYVICFALRHFNRHQTIPFVPFLAAAYLGVVIL